MRWVISILGASVCAFCGARTVFGGEFALGLGTIGLGALFVLETNKHQPARAAMRDALARWRQSPAFNPDSNLED